jgi:hypothetical protein
MDRSPLLVLTPFGSWVSGAKPCGIAIAMQNMDFEDFVAPFPTSAEDNAGSPTRRYLVDEHPVVQPDWPAVKCSRRG